MITGTCVSRFGPDQEELLPLHVPSGAGADSVQAAGAGRPQRPRVAQGRVQKFLLNRLVE